MPVADQADVVDPWITRARQKNSVVGCRSCDGVQLVDPLPPSGTLVAPTVAANPWTLDDAVDANEAESEIWNS